MVVDKLPGQQGFHPLPRRWPVERTFGWLQWFRRLNRDYEREPATSTTFVYLTSMLSSMNLSL